MTRTIENRVPNEVASNFHFAGLSSPQTTALDFEYDLRGFGPFACGAGRHVLDAMHLPALAASQPASNSRNARRYARVNEAGADTSSELRRRRVNTNVADSSVVREGKLVIWSAFTFDSG
jgi:hypothetical protein